MPVTQVGDLLRLQELDNEIASLSSQVAAIDLRLAHGEELAAALSRESECAAELDAAEREQRRVDAALEDLLAKLGPEEKRLYDGSVRSPKELQAIQHEVEHLQARKSELEEVAFGLMDKVEHARSASASAREARVSEESRWEAETAHLKDERVDLVDRHSAREAQRAEVRMRVPRTLLAMYDGLRQRKAGTAVVTVRGGTCSGCRVMLPDAVRRRALTSAVPVQCPNCERILSAAG